MFCNESSTQMFFQIYFFMIHSWTLSIFSSLLLLLLLLILLHFARFASLR
jgi:uncharacterized membrane protein